MDNQEKDWKELKDWQEKKEQKQKEELENRLHVRKGQKEKMMQETTKSERVIGKTIHQGKDIFDWLIDNRLVTFILVTCMACFVMIVINRIGLPNIKQAMKSQYKESTSNIERIETKDLGRGNKYYTYRYTKKPEFYFHIRVSGRAVDSDIEECKRKALYENWKDPMKEKFKIDEREKEGMLIKYEVYYEFQNFEQIDEAVESMYQLRKSLGKKSGDIDGTGLRSANGIYLTIFNWKEERTLEEEKAEAKRQYVSISVVQGEQEKFSQEILEQYCKPDRLDLYINGTKTEIACASYQPTGEYVYSLNKEFLQQVPGVIITKEEEYTYSWEYKGKEYDSQMILGNKEEDLQKLFGATFAYDYIHARVDITIK